MTVNFKLMLKVAEPFLGTKEIKDNSTFTNPEFANWLSVSGWSGGEKWCCYAIKALMFHAGFVNLLNEDYLNIYYKCLNGSVKQSFMQLSCHFPANRNPQPGSQFFRLKKNSSNHTGLIKDVFPNGNCMTLEGNSLNKFCYRLRPATYWNNTESHFILIP